MAGFGKYDPGVYPLAMDEKWNDTARGVLKAEMARRGVSAVQLADLLGENRRTVSNKIGEGKFSFAWALYCLHLIGVRDIRID